MIADGKRRVFVTLDKRVIEALDVLARSRQVHRSTVIDCTLSGSERVDPLPVVATGPRVMYGSASTW